MGDELTNDFSLKQRFNDVGNPFACDVRWGCFWQETPEDCLALYRDLLRSPAFCIFHDDFWIRPPQQPRIVAWNEKDRRRLPEMWNRFVQELNGSTNLLWQMEASALVFADAPTRVEQGAAFTNLFSLISEHRDELVASRFQLFSGEWGLGQLFRGRGYFGLYDSDYRSELSAIDFEYITKTIPFAQEDAVLPQQIAYLKANTPYDHSEFPRLFFARQFTKAQALKLQPFVRAYESNLVVQSQISVQSWSKLVPSLNAIASLEDQINHAVDPSLPHGSPVASVLPGSPGSLPVKPHTSTNVSPIASAVVSPRTNRIPAHPEVIHKPARVVLSSNPEPTAVTNIITVNKFFELPLEGVGPGANAVGRILAHQLCQEKLLLDFECLNNHPRVGY